MPRTMQTARRNAPVALCSRALCSVSQDDVVLLSACLDEEPWRLEALDEDEPLLWHAVERESANSARLLVERGAEIDARGSDGGTPLMMACEAGNLELASFLLDHGANPSLRDQSRSTALIRASHAGGGRSGEGHVAVIRRLLSHPRVAVDARDSEGCTALWWAIADDHIEAARVLLYEGGADHAIADKEGEAPLAIARQFSNGECLRLLQRYERRLGLVFQVSKARALVDGAESISRAAEKAGAETEAEVQHAREQEAPSYLRSRVEEGKPLPMVEVALDSKKRKKATRREVVRAVLDHVVRRMKADLFVEVVEMLREAE